MKRKEIEEQMKHLIAHTADLEKKVDRLWDIVKRLNKNKDVFTEENVNEMFMQAHEANDKLYAAVANYMNDYSNYEEVKTTWDQYCEKLKRIAELIKEVISDEQE